MKSFGSSILKFKTEPIDVIESYAGFNYLLIPPILKTENLKSEELDVPK
jgi:hypothetical protein